MKILFFASLFGTCLWLCLSGCDSSPSGEHTSPVTRWDDKAGSANEVYRIEQALRPGDGITVNMELKPPARLPLGPLTIITYGAEDPIEFSVRDHWLDLDAADVMLDKANAQHTDRTRRTVFLIKEIHQWQDTHPRPATVASAPPTSVSVAAPATVTKTVAPPGPPPAPAPSQPILGPFMHWVSMIVAVIAVAGALWVVALFSQDSYQVLSKSRARHKREAEVAKTKHEAQLAAIAAKAERENEEYLRGDRNKGMYGDYTPTNL